MRLGRIRRGQGLSRLNLVEPEPHGVAALTGTEEGCMEAQEQKKLHQVQTERDERNGEICTDPAESSHMISTPAPGQVAMISSCNF